MSKKSLTFKVTAEFLYTIDLLPDEHETDKYVLATDEQRFLQDEIEDITGVAPGPSVKVKPVK